MSARSGDAPQSKMLCPKCGKRVSLGDFLLKFDDPLTEIILYTCKTPNCEYENYPFAKDIETGDILAPYDLREILYPPDWVTINRLEQKITRTKR